MRYSFGFILILVFQGLIDSSYGKESSLQYFLHDLDRYQSLQLPELTLQLTATEEGHFLESGYKLQIAVETTRGNNRLKWFEKGNLFGFLFEYNLHFRKTEFEIFRRWVPFLKPILVNDHLEGNARKKFEAKLNYFEEGNLSIFEIGIRDQLASTDVLRIKGLKLRPEDPGKEVGNTIIKYRFVRSGRRQEATKWKNLPVGEIRIGIISVLQVNPVRYVVEDFETALATLHLKTGQYAQLEEGHSLEIYLESVYPRSARVKWNTSSEIVVQLIRDGKRSSVVQSEAEIKGDRVSLKLKGVIEESQEFLITGLKIETTKLNTTTLILNYDIRALPEGRFALLRRVEASLLTKDQVLEQFLFRPYVGLAADVIPVINKRSGGKISVIVNQSLTDLEEEVPTHEPTRLVMPGDRITLILPSDTPIQWQEPTARTEYNGYSLRRLDARRMQLVVEAPFSDILRIDGIRIAPSRLSAKDVQISYTFNYAQEKQFMFERGISSGFPTMRMEQVKVVKEDQKTVLKDIHLDEDNLVSTISAGSLIRMYIDNPLILFDIGRILNVEIINKQTNLATHDLILDLGSSNEDTLVFRSMKNIDPGSSYTLRDIPVNVEKEITRAANIIYLISSRGSQIFRNQDSEAIKIARLEIEADSQEFYATIDNTRNIHRLSPIVLTIDSDAGLIQRGEGIEISFDTPEIEWFQSSQSSTNQQDTKVSYIDTKEGRAKRLVIQFRRESRGHERIILTNATIALVDHFRSVKDAEMGFRLTADSTFIITSAATIAYAEVGFSSSHDQVFFLDQDDWQLYNILIKTRGLQDEFKNNQIVTIMLPEQSDLVWSRSSQVNLETTAGRSLGNTLRVRGHLAMIELEQDLYDPRDEFNESLNLLVSGLKIQKTDKILKDGFSLMLSLDEGRSIVALDNGGSTKKIILPAEEIDEKIIQLLHEQIFAMRTGAVLDIRLPEQPGLVWDTSRTRIIEGWINEFNFSSLDPNITYSKDRKSARISIDKGYGQLTQGLTINGIDKKRLSISGLRILRENNLNDAQALRLILETPYGTREVISNKRIDPHDWEIELGILGSADGYSEINEESFSNASLEPLIWIRPPQIKNPQGHGILDDRQILVYGADKTLLYNPLIRDFNPNDTKLARSVLFNTTDFIDLLYTSTEPKGKNWKSWYYLAWAKYDAQISGLSDYLDEQIYNKIGSELLTRTFYRDDLALADTLGFNPRTIHIEYPVPDSKSPRVLVMRQINAAQRQIEARNLTEAEVILLGTLKTIENLKEDNKDELLDLYQATVLLMLGKISIRLQDTNYENFRSSYAFNNFSRALVLYREAEGHQDYKPSMIDTIQTYQDKIVRMVRQRDHRQSGIRLPVDTSPTINRFDSTFVTINFRYDHDYTYRIKGIDGYGMRYYHGDGKVSRVNSRSQNHFGDQIQLSNSGAYKIDFRPGRQALKNLFVSSILGFLAFSLYAL